MTARVIKLPVFRGDGWDYGEGCVLVIGDFAFKVGADKAAEALAQEICRRWNMVEAAAELPNQESGS